MALPLRILSLLLLCVLAIPAAASTRGPLVLAAASLQEALTEVADGWAARGHARPVLSFAASSALARQIDSGAPADLFLSADEPWMDHLAARQRLRPGTRAPLLRNRLVLVAPAASKARLTIGPGFVLAATLGHGRLAMADPEAVPAGRYGKAALTYFGVWPQLAGKVAAAENVRAALALVERGQAPFGIVYATDARASSRVRVVDIFPENSHPPIIYPVAVLAASTHRDAAAFHLFLLSADARAIFQRHGFS